MIAWLVSVNCSIFAPVMKALLFIACIYLLAPFTYGQNYPAFDSLLACVESDKIIPPERFPIIENTQFELFIDTENYTHPIKSRVVSSRFGLRNVKFTNKYEMGIHRGIDILADIGTDVRVVFDGVVRVARYDPGYGNVVVVRHSDGLESLYAHLYCIYVKEGEHVKSGMYIGISGNTGSSTGPHLHFELSTEQGRFDPEIIIDFTQQRLKVANEG